MPTNQLKTSADYPQFYCRMNKEDMEQIEAMIVSILNRRKRKLKKNQRQPKRNEIIAEALKRGLKDIG